MGGVNELLRGFLSRPRFEVIPAKETEQAVVRVGAGRDDGDRDRVAGQGAGADH